MRCAGGLYPQRSTVRCPVGPTAAARAQRTNSVLVAAVASPRQAASPQPQQANSVPRAPGQLPFLGIAPFADLSKIFLRSHRALQEQGARVLEFELLGTKAVHMRHPEDIAFVLKTGASNFDKTPGSERVNLWLGNGLVTNTDASQHAAMRDIIMPAFRPEAIRSYTHMFAQVADALADVLLQSEGSPVALEPPCQRATLDVIGLAGFSYDFKALAMAPGSSSSSVAGGAAGDGRQHEVDDVTSYWLDILSPAMLLFFNVPLPDALIPGYQGYLRGVQKLDRVVEQMLAEHRAGHVTGNRRSLLTFMLEAQAAGNALVSDQQIRDELMTFMLAGSDTTATTLAFCLWELSRRPDCLAQVLAEVDDAVGAKQGPVDTADVQRMPLLTGCINETLRLYPAAPATARISVQACQVGGCAIPAGRLVVGNLFALHRNEDFWPRPDEWLPQRWLPHNASALAPAASSAFLPFSVGGRSCIGRYFAVLEAQVLLAQLLRRVTLAPAPHSGQLELKQALTLTAEGGIPVVPLPRQGASL